MFRATAPGPYDAIVGMSCPLLTVEARLARAAKAGGEPTTDKCFTRCTAKATDENLTAEDWGAIMEMCDKVTGDPSGPKESVQSIIRRMAHRNANVQLYTLEVSRRVACPGVEKATKGFG